MKGKREYSDQQGNIPNSIAYAQSPLHQMSDLQSVDSEGVKDKQENNSNQQYQLNTITDNSFTIIDNSSSTKQIYSSQDTKQKLNQKYNHIGNAKDLKSSNSNLSPYSKHQAFSDSNRSENQLLISPISPVIDVTGLIETSRVRTLKYQQIRVFLICYLINFIVQMQREFWSVAKDQIILELKLHIYDTQFFYLDAVQLISIFVSLCILHKICDKFDKRKILTVVLLAIMTCYFLCSLAGFIPIRSIGYLYFIHAITGASKCLLFPMLISIMAEWFTRCNRGLIFGIFMTSINLGYLFAMQFGTILLNNHNVPWFWIVLGNSILMLILACLIHFWLEPDPIQNGGYVIDEFNDRDKKLIKLLKKIKLQQAYKQTYEGSRERDSINTQLQKEQQFYYRVQTQSNTNSEVTSTDIINNKRAQLSIFQIFMNKEVLIYSSIIFISKIGAISFFYYLTDFLDYIGKESKLQCYSGIINVGAMLGNVSMGYVSDLLYSRRSPVIFFQIFMSTVLMIIIMIEYKYMNQVYYLIMLLLGFFVNGFTQMIKANCSTDIGKQMEITHQQKLLAKVCCIMEAFDCLGQSIGIFLIGWAHQDNILGFTYGFWLLITISIGVCFIPLCFILPGEIMDIRLIMKNRRKII